MPKKPTIKTALPGPRAKKLIKLDQSFVSPSYTRVYPLVVDQAEGLWVHDVDGNIFMILPPALPLTPPVTAIRMWSRPYSIRPSTCCTCPERIFITPPRFSWLKN